MSTPVPVLSQDADRCDLEWRAYDPVSLSFDIAADWSGTYKAEVRDKPQRSGLLLATLTIDATYPVTRLEPEYDGWQFTRFTITLADSSTVPNGGYWDLQKVGGPTRLAGRVVVVADVTR